MDSISQSAALLALLSDSKNILTDVNLSQIDQMLQLIVERAFQLQQIDDKTAEAYLKILNNIGTKALPKNFLSTKRQQAQVFSEDTMTKVAILGYSTLIFPNRINSV